VQLLHCSVTSYVQILGTLFLFTSAINIIELGTQTNNGLTGFLVMTYGASNMLPKKRVQSWTISILPSITSFWINYFIIKELSLF